MTTWLVAVDPGVRESGVAVYHGGRLWSATRVSTDDMFLHLPGANSVIVEAPQVYGGRSARGSTQDLLDLSRVVGRVEQKAPHARVVAPREWKGTVPKDIMCRRVWRRLSEVEQERTALPGAQRKLLHAPAVVALSKRTTDVLDAVGLGLFALGRL